MRRRRSLWILVAIVLLSSLFLNVWLATSNNRWRDKWQVFFRETVNPGDQLATIVGVDRLGARFATDVRKNESGTLVVTMSIGCPACAASIGSWKRLMDRASASGIPVLVVSKDWYPDLMKSKEAAELGGTLIADPTSGTFTSLHMILVPQTILVDRSGAVIHTWIGGISPARETEIAKSLMAAKKSDSEQ